MAYETPVAIENVSYYYGSGALRKQILFDVSTEIEPGQIVIITGPSGSGKTTLLTLAGALRCAQEGSVRVLGSELRDAGASKLEAVRKQIGYIFQSHNLIDALTARRNVEMALYLHPHRNGREVRERAGAMLEAVGLGDRKDHYPSQLSGGQRQRVAIARALVAKPRIILADEPTASLDKQSGRDVVERMQELARGQGVTVLLVTHDNRILDIADRIVHLEDGRLSSFQDAVIADTQHLMGLLADSLHREDLQRRVEALTDAEFGELLEKVTFEARHFLGATSKANDEAYTSMLDQALFAFTYKIGLLCRAERASLFLLDEERGELLLRVAQDEGGVPLDVRMPRTAGIAGHVVTTGKTMRIDDAYAHPLFNPDVDKQSGFRTRNILCLPVRDARGRVFAAAQLLNCLDGDNFGEEAEKRFESFVGSVGVILESWAQMADRRSETERERRDNGG